MARSLKEPAALAPGRDSPSRWGEEKMVALGTLVLTFPQVGGPSQEHTGRTRWAGYQPPLPPAQLPTAGPRSPDPCRFSVLWPEIPNLSAGRQLAHFRRQPPGPPGPLAEQPGMTSVPVLSRGFAAQECRRGLREADAQGADVRPHFFPQVSTRSPSHGADGDFTRRPARPPCALTAGAGRCSRTRGTWACGLACVRGLAAPRGWNS